MRLHHRIPLLGLLIFGALVPAASAASEQVVHPQVVGGGQMEISAYPFAGRIETSVDDYGNSVAPGSAGVRWAGYCTGSLIAPQWVLTAAHCALPYEFGNAQNRWRVNFLNAIDKPVATVDRAYVHPGYSAWITKQNAPQDIALMHLSSPASVDSIALPKNRSEDQLHRSNAALAGYGMVDNNNRVMSSVLNGATLQLGSDSYCAAQAGAGADKINNQFQLCRIRTSSITGSEGISCNGDSGGPVMVANQDSSALLLVGIISWGAAAGDVCWSPGAYDVYTRVGALTDWISRITKQNFSDNPGLNMSTAVSRASIPAARPLSSNKLRIRVAVAGGASTVRIWPVRYVSRRLVYPAARRPVSLRLANTRGRLVNIPIPAASWHTRQCINLVLQTVNGLNNYSPRRVYSFRSYSKRHRIYLKAGSCAWSGSLVR